MLKDTQHTIKHKRLIYDVGMHQGEDTDYYLKKEFRVIGFEANPDLVMHCRERFSNEINRGQLVVVEGAITECPAGGTKDKTITFYQNNDTSIWGTVADEWARRNETLGTSSNIIEVPVVDFRECLKKFGVPHYLKIDIEGMDTVCLRALMHVEEKPDYLSIESEKVLFGNLMKEFNLLKQLGYDRFQAVQQADVTRRREPNPSNEGNYAGHQFPKDSSGLFGADLPDKWKDYAEILKEYETIFRRYRWLGDYGKLTRSFPGKLLRKVLSILLCKPIPGWYDTHAKHSSVVH